MAAPPDHSVLSKRKLDLDGTTQADIPSTKHRKTLAEFSNAASESSTQANGLLRVQTASENCIFSHADDSSDVDSLFDEVHSRAHATEHAPNSNQRVREHKAPALRTAPPIHGLYFSPLTLLHSAFADSVMQQCMNLYFQNESTNQIMLFSRAGHTDSPLPPFLTTLLSNLSSLLQPILPAQTYELLFPRKPLTARQAILNLYKPGEGITPHVDLLGRFGDGVIGVSFGSGCVMHFERAEEPCASGKGWEEEGVDIAVRKWDLYLPERSILVLSNDARYHWTHGISDHTEDFVQRLNQENLSPGTNIPGQWIKRKTRLSITFRWLLPGADVVGMSEEDL
jgi:alkylated DNA repair dioxygenase AlkB